MHTLTLCAAAALSLSVLPAVASAATAPTQSVVARGTGGVADAGSGFQIAVDASKSAGRAVKGSFRGTVAPAGGGLQAPGLASISGRVTCLQVTGRTASFLYPLERVESPVGGAPAEQLGIVITLVDGPTDTVGFSAPQPLAAFGGRCDAGPAPLDYRGSLRVRG